MLDLQMAILRFFSEAAPANGVDTAFYIFTVVSLPSDKLTDNHNPIKTKYTTIGLSAQWSYNN